MKIKTSLRAGVDGTVKFYNAEKGFGFIMREGDSRDIFLHASNIQSGTTLSDGAPVSFDLVDGRKGQMAVNVKLR